MCPELIIFKNKYFIHFLIHFNALAISLSTKLFMFHTQFISEHSLTMCALYIFSTLYENNQIYLIFTSNITITAIMSVVSAII